MKVKITCTCRAAFVIKSSSRHPSEISCPNCGQVLPFDASSDLLKMLDAFEVLEAKLSENSERYKIKIRNP